MANIASLCPGTPSPFDLALGLATAALLVIVLLWQYSQYVGEVFCYEDLTIISDFFSNAIMHGKPFWVTNGHFNHLKVHFTPSLLLLVPLFAVFKGQFALIALLVLAVCVAIFVCTREQYLSLRLMGLSPLWRSAFSLPVFVAFAGNVYTMRVFSSAHFEPFFILAATCVLVALRRGARYRVLIPLILITIGIRQDAGFFLAFLFVSCLFAPRSWSSLKWQKPLVCTALCLVYFAIASLFVLPSLGSDAGTRFWHEWGNTWPEVVATWLKSPGRVWNAIGQSAFLDFNSQLWFLPALNVFAWLVNQAPGILFYTADTSDKQQLTFYNASFLLPGLMLCFVFAEHHALSFALRITRHNGVLRSIALALLLALFGGASAYAASNGPRQSDETIHIGDMRRHDPFVTGPVRALLRCKGVRSVAADYLNIAFAPLMIDKYNLPSAQMADLIVLPLRVNKHVPPAFFVKRKLLANDLLRDGSYRVAARIDGYELYVRSTIDCRLPESLK